MARDRQRAKQRKARRAAQPPDGHPSAPAAPEHLSGEVDEFEAALVQGAGEAAAEPDELQRVQWPDRRQVAQATAVVIGFVVIAGAYLGIADRVAQEIVNFVL